MSSPDPGFTVSDIAGHVVVYFQTDSLTSTFDVERAGLALYRLIDERTGVGAEVRTAAAKGPAAARPQRDPLRLVLDFSKVNSYSSQAVGLLLALTKKLSRGGTGTLTLCGVGSHLIELLRITRLDRMLKIAATQDEAVAPKDGGGPSINKS